MLMIYNGSPIQGIISLQRPEFLVVLIPAALLALGLMIYFKKQNAKSKMNKIYKDIASNDFKELKKLVENRFKYPYMKIGDHLPGIGGIVKRIFIEECAKRNHFILEDYIKNVLPFLDEIIKENGLLSEEEKMYNDKNETFWVPKNNQE